MYMSGSLPLPPEQILTITVEAGSEWGKNLAKGVTWRVQCVPEDIRGGEPSGDGNGAPQRDRAQLCGFEMKLGKKTRFEIPFGKLRMNNGEGLSPDRIYLWRVAAAHPTFGEGPFSNATRVSFVQDVTEGMLEGQPPLLRLYDNSVQAARRLAADRPRGRRGGAPK